jgi:ABC-type polysaccharide/polyol phosphate transport system ATPase subunit
MSGNGRGQRLAIEVEDVSKRFRLYQDKPTSLKQALTRFRRTPYEEFWALREVSLDVRAGESFGLIGHNGSGKSTLLRLMARIHQPTSGKVTTRGRVSALLELGAGFHPELSGRENIYLNGAILGLDKRELDRVFDEIVDFSGLESFIDSPVKVYSSGMYVRLGFAVSVHVRPDVLIIDEVIAVGDADFQNRCFDHLYKIRREGRTIVVVSHSVGLMQTLCDRIAWLDHGRLLAVGQPIEVTRAYTERVADATAERLARTTGTETALATSAAGDRDIEIIGFDVLDADGEPIALPRAGSAVTFRIHYHARKRVDHPNFSISVATETGVSLSVLTTNMAGIRTGELHGTGHLDCTVDRLNYLPGTLVVGAQITDRHELHAFDSLPDGYELHIRAGDPVGNGLVPLGGRWSDALSDLSPRPAH